MDENTKFCQSCGMPMEGSEAQYGKEADGTPSALYCSFCYENGKFTSEDTMESMIESCVPFMIGEDFKTEEEARAMMLSFFPTLERWKKS